MQPDREVLSPETMTESALIGAAVVFPACVDEIPPQLEPGDFQVRELGAAWSAIRARHMRGQSTDQASVIGDLPPAAADALEAAAGAAATGAHAREHAELIIRRAAARRLVAGLQALPYGDLDDLTANASALVASAVERAGLASGEDVFADTDERMRRVLEVASEARQGKHRGVRTGIGKIDKATGGIRPGSTWIVGARPSVGKSALLLQLAHVAAAAGAWSVFISAEMPILELAKREAAMASGMNALKVADGQLADAEWTELTRGVGQLAYRHQGRLLMADRLGSDVEKIIHTLRKLRRQGKLDVVFVDYIQKLSARRLVNRSANRNTELEAISKMFAEFDRETGAATVLASQLSRKMGEPSLDHLRDSGALEQDADVVVLLHRENDEDTTRKFMFAKNRQGPTAATWCALDNDRMQFCEITRREENRNDDGLF